MKDQILTALRAFIRQRPGLEFCNYGDVSAYRSESRDITRDRHHAEELLHRVEYSDITAEQLIHAANHAFGGRLSIVPLNDGVRIEYTTGQYWPTEYRKAVCAVLSSALWDHWRTPESTGDSLRRTARLEVSRAVANRWFR